MSKVPLTSKQMIAFKIGARARKFVVEGCPVEGFDYIYGCLADAAANDAQLHALLVNELAKFEKRVAEVEDEL